MKKPNHSFFSRKLLSMLLTVLFFIGCSESNDKKIEKIVSSMSLRQKSELVVGASRSRARRPTDDNNANTTAQEPSEYEKMAERVSGYVPGAAGRTAEFPELGITSQVLADGPAGLRIQPQRQDDENTYYCTAFPIATVLASTWDTKLVESVGTSMGEEVLEYGADIILGPALNLQRDPLCGRNFEYYSEDPLIAGKMAAAMIRGIQSNGVGTSIKHFVANNQETNRNSVNEIISQRALRELYLRSFEIAVKEGEPWTVMSSYNKINGKYTSENNDLLTKILRDDWGFKGYVMTDWGGGSDPIAQMNAGNDLLEPGNTRQIDAIENAVKEGTLDEAVLDRNVSRILNIMMKTPRYKGYAFTNKPDLKAHAEVTRQAATYGMVLLKNDVKTLPLSSGSKKVAAFGNTSYKFISGGTGSGDVNEAYTISLIQGLADDGYQTDPELTNIYKAYFIQDSIKQAEERAQQSRGGGQNNFFRRGRMRPAPEMSVSAEVANKMAQASDVALITIGRNSGEGSDRRAVEGDFYLTPDEKEMIKTVSDAFHAKGKKAVVILNIGGVIETASWRDMPDAILCAWQPGQEAGNSVVDVISGKVNPSGKLAVSFPVSYDETPTAMNFPGHEVVQEGEEDNTADQSGFSFNRRRPWEVDYEEDIYVGYRYYTTFDVPVAYEFGYGLSYTNFEFSNMKIGSEEFDGKVNVSVNVKNTGEVAGREVVQLYVSKPDGKLKKPAEELIAFNKTKLLNPEETVTVNFTVDTRDLASFDSASSSWLAESGNYTLKIGASSKDIKTSESIELSENLSAGNVSNVMAPQKEMELLTK